MGDFTVQLDDSEAEELRQRFSEGGVGFNNLPLLHVPNDGLTGPVGGLAAALANVQAECPEVVKKERARIEGKEGRRSYEYSYADLAAVTRAVLPILGKNGLAWITKPTLADGRMVLHYKLSHTSGECEEGFYPLPDRGSPQDMGGAITYARRYALCAVTGVAPDEDDDDAAAATAAHQRGQLATPSISEYERRMGLALLRVPGDEERDQAGSNLMAASFQQSLDFRRCLHEKAAWGAVAAADGTGPTWEALFQTRVEAEIAAATLPAMWRLVRQMLNDADLGRAYARQLKDQADRITAHQQELINHLTQTVLGSTAKGELAEVWAMTVDRKHRGEINEEQVTQLRAIIDERAVKLGVEVAS
jgi:hypothetical protein